MKKLENKIIITIFVILNIFAVSLLVIYNYQNYNTEYERVRNSLRSNFRLNSKNNLPMRFIDLNVYTVVIDNNEITSIISHTPDGNVSDEIVEYAKSIINSDEYIHIGNLYKDKYSFRKLDFNITIVDNSLTNSRLSNIIRISVILLILIELVSYLIASLLSKWIIKPVEDAFDKQKQFIADASHELKTPIAVIMASADALEKNKNEKKWIKNIQSESERMNKLVTSLLDLSKVENGKTVLEEVNLSKLVEKSVLTLESLMFEKNIELKYKINDDIIINSNSDDMKQLVSILLDNAIKHSEDDGKIVVNLEEVKNVVTLTVKNKGDAIKKGDEEKIFERFYRSDESRNRDENRYGLGLAIAKGIVEKNNGNISASSANGYTTFKVVLKNK